MTPQFRAEAVYFVCIKFRDEESMLSYLETNDFNEKSEKLYTYLS
jgi:hypothetical protein